ncbi:MAG: ATP-binding protein, partial [Pseudomonadota bacterium]
MEIKKFCLNNVGRFEKIDIPLAPNEHSTGNVTVFVGNNGAGKTSLLKSLATSLSWFVSRIRSETGNGSPIPELVIKNKKTSAAIDIEVFDEQGQSANPDADEADHLFHWTIAKSRKGRIGEHKSNLGDVTLLAEHYRYSLSHNHKTS